MANPNIAKLKKKASDFEQKKQFDRALSLYIQLLEEAGRDLDDADLQLYNRVGDLLQRQGNVTEALAYYEKAVDVYAERGFLNNAIALCNKVLRQSPARTSVYYKLGKISATKGFKSDAKKNFLEYAERMQKSGHTDEAFRALKEFADLCPDQDDIRLMLADWMQKENRKSEAVEQLETLYLKLEEEGREVEAKATIDRMKAIDPDAEPRQSESAATHKKKNDLIFLDLEAEDVPSPREAEESARADEVSDHAMAGVDVVPALEGLVLTFHPDADEEAGQSAPNAPQLDGFESTASDRADLPTPTPTEVVGLEQASDEGEEREERSVPTESLLTVEADSWSEPIEPVPHVDGLESPRVSLTGTNPVLAPLIDGPPMTGEEFRSLAIRSHEDGGALPPRSAHDLALPSDLPLLESHDPRLDLLRVMETPIGSPVIPELATGDTPSGVDLLSLPPVGELLGASPSLEWPVTGSADPVAIGATPDDDVAAGGDVHASGADAHDGAEDGAPQAEAHVLGTDATPDEWPRERAARDTAELVALDSTARPTDELLAVPSEDIDEETRRSLREEFALDGDETPDAWVEAALSARDDFSLDHLLTPYGVPAIVPAVEPERAAASAEDGSAEETAGDEHERTESLEEAFARLSSTTTASAEQEANDATSAELSDVPVIESASEWKAIAEGEPGDFVVTSEGDAPLAETPDYAAEAATDTGSHEFVDAVSSSGDAPAPAPEFAGDHHAMLAPETLGHSVDDEVAPESPGGEHEVEPDVAGDLPVVHVAADGTAEFTSPSASSDDLVQDAEEDEDTELAPREFDLLDELLPPFMRHDGESPASVAAGDDRDDGGAHDPSMAGSALDVDALRALMLDRGLDIEVPTGPPELAGDAIASAFSEGDVELPLLEVDDLLSPSGVDFIVPIDLEPASTADLLGEPPTFGDSDQLDFEPAPLFDEAPTAQEDDFDTPDALTEPDEGGVEWTDDDAPEVLIDGEWHDERMAGLVSGEVSAIRPPGGDVPSRPRARWDDLSAALMWPPNEDGDGAGAPPHDGAAPDAGVTSGAEQGATEHAPSRSRGGTPRRSLSFGGVEAQLRRRIELEPGNLTLRRQLGEALLDQGSRIEGLEELDVAMRGFEMAGDLENARRVADVVLRVVPTSVRHHQKRVEYAVRSNDRVRLVEAYVELADSLFRSGEPEKARVVYSRVLELSPGNGRARFALGLLSDEELAERGATPPASPSAPPPAPSPADMVSMFDRSIPRTPERDVTSISAELPIIADSLFTSPPPPAEPDTEGGAAEGDDATDIREVVALEREQTTAALNAAQDTHGTDAPAPDEIAAEGSLERAEAPQVDGEGNHVSVEDAPLSEEESPLAPDAPYVESGAYAAVSGLESPVQDLSPDDSREDAPEARDSDAPESAGDASPELADASGDDFVAPFPAPSLDDQIDEAFAAPPIIELAGGVQAHASDGFDHHDGSVTPPLGAAAFATPFSSGVVPTPTADLARVQGGTPRSATPVAASSGDVPVIVTPRRETPAIPPAAVASRGGSDDDFIDLGSWLRDDEPVRSTRMVTAEATPTGDEQADFDEMLRRFKQGIAANVDDEDFASHYDLGVAYKEMGLVDEAIAEFQKSLRGDTHRVRSYEALGQCFVEKGQHELALTLLQRAIETTRADDQQLVGVLYLLGYASEVMARHADALRYYQRVFAVDIEFRDVAQRVAAIEQLTQ